MTIMLAIIEFAVTAVFCLAAPVAILFMLSWLILGIGAVLVSVGYSPAKPKSKTARAKDGYWQYQNVLARAKLSQRRGETAGQAIARVATKH